MKAESYTLMLALLLGFAPVLVWFGYIMGSVRTGWMKDAKFAALSPHRLGYLRPENRRGFWIGLIAVAICWSALLLLDRTWLRPMHAQELRMRDEQRLRHTETLGNCEDQLRECEGKVNNAIGAPPQP